VASPCLPQWFYAVLRPEFLSSDLSKKECEGLGLFSSILGHVRDGNFHQAVVYDPSSPTQTQIVQECVRKMVHKAVEMEGTVSVCPLEVLY
jgi:hypothetical protein